MNRYLIRAALLALAAVPLACSAGEAPYEAGKQYLEVPAGAPAPTVSQPDHVKVQEAFWYGCPHCYAFEPTVEAWVAKKPAYVEFERIPSSLGRPQGMMHSKAFYTAQLLGIGDKIHRPLFDAIHQQHLMMDTQDALRELFIAKGGVTKEDFDGAFDSFAVDSKVRQAEGQLRDYGLTGVPSVIVGGKYVVTGTTAGGHDKVFPIVDFLVEKVRKETKAK